MTSKQMKYHVLSWMKYDKQFGVVTTEYLNNSDVFGVNRNLFPVEVEIKCSWKDFMSEIHTINFTLNGDSAVKHHAKSSKHRSYLLSETQWYPRPRYFYFAVTEELGDRALEQLNAIDYGYQKLIPYGLLVVRQVNGGYDWEQGEYVPDRVRWIVTEAKKAEKMSDKKFDGFYRLAMKVTNENIGLREQLLKREASQ